MVSASENANYVFIKMTIKVTKITVDDLRVMKCLKCLNQEESTLNGLTHTWKYFEFELQDSGSVSPKLICMHCGHTHPRYSLTLANHVVNAEVHICKLVDGSHIRSKCGELSGVVDRKFYLVNKIDSSSKACDRCALADWESYQNVDWLTDTDKGIETDFFQHVLKIPG